jgi:hypothetical protein
MNVISSSCDRSLEGLNSIVLVDVNSLVNRTMNDNNKKTSVSRYGKHTIISRKVLFDIRKKYGINLKYML